MVTKDSGIFMRIFHNTSFMHRKKSVLGIIISLSIWGIIAVAALSYPIIQEPDTLPPETWSYYRGKSEGEQFLIKNRNILLFVLFLCSIIPEIFLVLRDYTKLKK